MDLRCRKTNCKYNKDLTCTAPNISITSNLICLEYQNQTGKGKKDFSKYIFSETPPKIANYRHLNDVCLHCDAKCIFNKSGKCMANGITINSAYSNDPKCMTFLKP